MGESIINEDYISSQEKAWEILNTGGNIFLTGPVGIGMEGLIIDFLNKQRRDGKKVALVEKGADYGDKYLYPKSKRSI